MQPKRTTYNKVQKGRIKGLAQRGNSIDFGTFGLKALEPTWITARQIEALRVVITRVMERRGNVWPRVFPNKPITKKPAEVRMGKGKGAVSHWVAVVKPGRILFEMQGLSVQKAQEAARLAGHKLGIKTRLVVRKDYEK